MATDFVVQRNLSSDQQYWTIGQTIRGEWNKSSKFGFYAWVCYFSRGKYSNQLSATAKDVLTLPQSIAYTNNGQMRFTQLSLGLKKYWKGAFDADESWNLYSLSGLGILLGHVGNSQNPRVDTSFYEVPVWHGTERFKRLTLDLGLGLEIPMGGDLFVYTEAKTFIPLTYFPSNYILNNKYTPLTANFNLGVRVLF